MVLELVFDLSDRVMRGRIKQYSIGFQEGELKALLCELGETKCKCMFFFRVNIGAVFEAGSMADPAPLSNLVILLYTVRVED